MNRAFLRVLIGGKPTGSYTVPFGETVEIRLGMAEASQVKFYLGNDEKVLLVREAPFLEMEGESFVYSVTVDTREIAPEGDGLFFFHFEAETSAALGFGFRCGFLGLLHMEIIQERLEREYNLDLITTAPNVSYRVTTNDGTTRMVDNPLDYPDPMDIQLAEEPFVKVNLMAPQEYVGNIMDLATSRRGEFKDMVYLDANRVELHYEMPLNEIIYDFFDALKSRTRGYGSLDYELIGYRPSRLVKLDILLNGDIVDALSFILFADNAYPRARKICERLKENIPRAQFEIPVQAAIGGKIIARETIKALRKDVLAKCYGGDITRKKKLLEKQKEGKKRMRTFGTVSVPSEAFMAVLKLDED